MATFNIDTGGSNNINKHGNNLFSFFIVLYPILNRYKTLISFFTLSETILFLFWVIRLLQVSRRIKVIIPVIPFTIYLLIRAAMSYCGVDNYEIVDAVGSTLRVFYIYASFMFLVPAFFNIDKAIMYLRIISWIIGIYAILQIIMAQNGIFLSSYLPFLAPYDGGELDLVNSEKYFYYGFQFRPTSFLNEPAALCVYLILPMIVSLFKPGSKTRSDIFSVILYSVVCIISLSSTGIMMVTLIWIIYLIYYLRSNTIGAIVLSVALLSAFIFFLNSDLYKYFLNRTFHGNIANGLAYSTRFNSVNNMWENSNSIKGILFGGGLVGLNSYLPGLQRIYSCLGLIAVVLLLAFLIREFIHVDITKRLIIVIYIILNIGTEIALGCFALYYMAFFVNSNFEVEDNDYKKLLKEPNMGSFNSMQNISQ